MNFDRYIEAKHLGMGVARLYRYVSTLIIFFIPLIFIHNNIKIKGTKTFY